MSALADQYLAACEEAYALQRTVTGAYHDYLDALDFGVDSEVALDARDILSGRTEHYHAAIKVACVLDRAIELEQQGCDPESAMVVAGLESPSVPGRFWLISKTPKRRRPIRWE